MFSIFFFLFCDVLSEINLKALNFLHHFGSLEKSLEHCFGMIVWNLTWEGMPPSIALSGFESMADLSLLVILNGL